MGGLCRADRTQDSDVQRERSVFSARTVKVWTRFIRCPVSDAEMSNILPAREFISVYIVAVYIPTDANSKNALQELYDLIKVLYWSHIHNVQ